MARLLIKGLEREAILEADQLEFEAILSAYKEDEENELRKIGNLYAVLFNSSGFAKKPYTYKDFVQIESEKVSGEKLVNQLVKLAENG